MNSELNEFLLIDIHWILNMIYLILDLIVMDGSTIYNKKIHAQ